MLLSEITAAQNHVRKVAKDVVEAGKEIGIQAVAYLDGKCVVDIAEGLADPATGRRVDHDTLFNVFSVSKAVSAVCMHIAIDRGLIGYDEPIVRVWPEFGVNGKEATTVADILTHRSGVPQMPLGTSTEKLGDWDWMVKEIAALTPIDPPGTRALYQPMTHGWLIGEVIRRADPMKRDFQTFLREELSEPLNAPDLWMGLPESEFPRVAKLRYDVIDRELSPLTRSAMPPEVGLNPMVFERPEVRKAVAPAVGGIFSARSCARVWAMIAQGGVLDGVRILSEQRVATFAIPRGDEPDIVMYGQIMPLSIAGFWLGMPLGSTAAARDRRTICHPGAGNTIAWADPQTGLAVSICHNRMYRAANAEEDGVLAVSNAIREVVGVA